MRQNVSFNRRCLFTSDIGGKPGRKPKDSAFKKKQLGNDAKILVALMKNQPQTKEALEEASGIKGSTFYRIISFLQNSEIIQCVGGMYALSSFDFLDKTLEDAFRKVPAHLQYVPSVYLVQATGRPWREIEAASFRVAKKLGFTPVGMGDDTEFIKTQ